MVVRIDSGAGAARLSYADDVRPGGSGVGQALAGVAQDMSQIGAHFAAERRAKQEEQDRQADQLYVAQAGADWRLRKAKELDDGLNQYDGAQPGFADGYSDKYRTEAQKLLEQAPERVRNQLQLELVRQGEVLTAAAYEGESGKRQAYTMTGLTTTADKEADGIVDTPDLFEDSIAALPNLAAGAPGGQRDKFARETASKYATAYAEGQLTQDPDRLKSELEGGNLDAYLNPQQKAAWLQSASGAIEKNQTQARLEAERAQRTLESDARDLTGRAVAYYNAGLPPPQELLNAARDSAQRAGDAGAWESVELARYKFGKDSTTETSAAARKAIGDVSDALKLGLTPGQEMIEDAAKAVASSKSPELAEQLMDMLGLAGKQREFAFMTPDAAAKRLTELRGMPATRESTKELDLLQKVTTARDKAIGDNNLVGWLASNGVLMTPLQANDPDLADAVRRRAQTMAVAGRQVGAPFQLFGKAERETFGRQLSQLPAAERLNVLSTLAAELGPEAGTALKEISKTAPADAQAGLLMLFGRSQAAKDTATGLEQLKQNPKLGPPRGTVEGQAKIQEAESAVIGRAMLPDLAEERAAITEAAGAIYVADRIRRGAADGDFDVEAYKRALQTAAGQEGDRGGFGWVNDYQTLLPPQLKADDVKALMQSDELFGDHWYNYSHGDPENGKPGGPPAWSSLSASEWAAASDAQRKDSLHRRDPKDLRAAKLVTRGNGLYWLSTTDPAKGPKYVLDLYTREPFVLDLRRAESPDARSKYAVPLAERK